MTDRDLTVLEVQLEMDMEDSRGGEMWVVVPMGVEGGGLFQFRASFFLPCLWHGGLGRSYFSILYLPCAFLLQYEFLF